MARYLMTVLAAAVGIGAAARAGGPPPVYVVVDKVTLEPSDGAPERIKIWGSFVRLENVDRYEYGRPVEGYVYLGLGGGGEVESRAEWERWRKAAGTGRVVAVGACGRAGSLLTVAIRKPDERLARPDATYSPGHIGAAGEQYVGRDGDRARPRSGTCWPSSGSGGPSERSPASRRGRDLGTAAPADRSSGRLQMVRRTPGRVRRGSGAMM